MKRADIEHLASLARIRLDESELEQLKTELPAIMAYVSAVSEIAEDGEIVPQVGVRHNIFRQDTITNESGHYSTDIIAEMPHTDGRFLAVKKILHTED